VHGSATNVEFVFYLAQKTILEKESELPERVQSCVQPRHKKKTKKPCIFEFHSHSLLKFPTGVHEMPEHDVAPAANSVLMFQKSLCGIEMPLHARPAFD